MELHPDRAGPYLRALQAGLHALAPHEAYVPLREATAHTTALDPALSGDVLLPADVDDLSGLPAFPWMERAIAASVLAAREGPDRDASDEQVLRARALDPVLGARMAARRELRRFLRNHALLPSSRVSAAVRRMGATTDFAVTADRLSADGRWTRIAFDVSGPRGWESEGALRAVPTAADARTVAITDEGLVHLLARHAVTPLLALKEQLEASLGGRVLHLSRGAVGPFWFPGGPFPDDAPAELGGGLVLHLSLEIVGTDVHRSLHLDPWRPPSGRETVPDGYGLFRERRFAVSPPLIEATRRWTGGGSGAVVPLAPQPVRRIL